jgi:NADH-quinone oxidoreductase subunit G
VAERIGRELPDAFGARAGGEGVDDFHRATAEALVDASGNGLIVLGDGARMHSQASELRSMAAWLADASGVRIALLPEADGAAAWLAGCVPHRIEGGRAAPVRGLDARAMIAQPRRGYLLFGIDPSLDSMFGDAARRALEQAEFVAVVSTFQGETSAYADVQLPLAPFTESEGTLVNVNGAVQTFGAAVPSAGEARPGWKVLRVLANFLGLPGYQYVEVGDVRHEIHAGDQVQVSGRVRAHQAAHPALTEGDGSLERVLDVPLYAVDPIVRRAPALGQTADNPPPAARMSHAQIGASGLESFERVVVRCAEGTATLPLVVDERVPQGCVYVPSGYPETSAIGAAGRVDVAGVGQ